MRKILSTLVIVVCTVIFCLSSYKLYDIWTDYKEIGEVYDSVESTYTQKYATEAASASEAEKTEKEIQKEEEKEPDPPLSVDWAGLKNRNPDVVGWVYIDATQASYPIVQGEDNQEYLHKALDGRYLFAGCIFLSAGNEPDFSDANSIVYGHHMKDGSMFGLNRRLKDQATYDANPYFWILTPEGNYRYRIYSVAVAEPNSDPYILWKTGGAEFLEWEKKLQKMSLVKNDVKLTEDDHTVILSCCEAKGNNRTLVAGICCSKQQPPTKTEE